MLCDCFGLLTMDAISVTFNSSIHERPDSRRVIASTFCALTASPTHNDPITIRPYCVWRRQINRLVCAACPARSGRPANVAVRLCFGPSITDVFRTFGQRYQRTFSGVTFVERPRERPGYIRLQLSHNVLRKHSLNVMNTYSLQKLLTAYHTMLQCRTPFEVFNGHFSSISLNTDRKLALSKFLYWARNLVTKQ